MSSYQQTGFPSHINGEEVISIVQGKKHFNSATFQGMIDRNEYLYSEENSRYHLGMLASFGMQGRESYPMITKLLEKGSELLVNGFFGEFTYDKPFYDPKPSLRTVASTVAEAGDYPGIDESQFDIILSEKCYPGDIIGTDLYGDEDQLYVIGSEASDLVGEGWRTTVTLTTADNQVYYNVAYLEAGINYYKINHAGVEYTTQFTGIDLDLAGNPTATLKARFKLGGIRGVETFVTGFADVKAAGFDPIDGKNDDVSKAVTTMQNKYADGNSMANTVIFGNKAEYKAGNYANMRATSLGEFLVEKTLMKRTATSHMWQRRGKIMGTNGAISYLNEGVWHQLRRGKIITIPKFGGITKAHISEAVNYVYRNNPELSWEEREIVFEVGKLAENNLLLIFQNEIQQQFTAIQANAGLLQLLIGTEGFLSDSLRTSLVTGKNLNELEMTQMIRFTKVKLMGIGTVSFKHNPALDHLAGNSIDFSGQFQNGYDWTSHSMIIWDITDAQYSNNSKGVENAKTMQGDSKVKNNLYLIRPEEGMTYKGQENGRWDRGKTSGIISSSKVIGQGFWAFNASAQWMPYPENVVIIELSKGARRAGMVPYNYQ